MFYSCYEKQGTGAVTFDSASGIPHRLCGICHPKSILPRVATIACMCVSIFCYCPIVFLIALSVGRTELIGAHL